MAVGNYGTVLWSQNGIAWIISQNSHTTAYLNGVAYCDGEFVAVGLSGTILQSEALPYDNLWDDVDKDDHGHGEDGATPVEINSTTNGSIEVGGDYDWFVVDVPSSGTLSIYTTGDTDSYGYWRKAGTSTIYQDDDSGDGGNFRFDIEDASEGIYFIAIAHASSSGTGDYQLRVNYSAR